MQSERKKGEIEIDLADLIKLLWRNTLVILLAATVVCAAVLAYTVFLVTPMYKAQASMYVNNSSFSFGQTSFSISSSELSASSSLAKAYIFILNTRETLEEVLKETGLDYSYEKLSKMINTQEVSGTAIFTVTVSSESPSEAELIANAIVKILPLRIEEIIDGSTVRTVSFAIVPAHRSSPSYTKNAVLGFIAGAVISCGVLIVREFGKAGGNRVIGGAEDIKRRYPDILVLASIPDMSLAARKGRYYSSYYDTEKGRGKRK